MVSGGGGGGGGVRWRTRESEREAAVDGGAAGGARQTGKELQGNRSMYTSRNTPGKHQ